MKLQPSGRCCGRKPIEYKRKPAHKFCPRCDASYEFQSGQQIENWAWKKDASGEFVRQLKSNT